MKNERDTVVGVFLDKQTAQRAIQLLQQAGFQASTGNQGGNVTVTVNNAGDRGEEALGIMLQNGAENIDMVAAQGGSTTGSTSSTTTTQTGSMQTGSMATAGRDMDTDDDKIRVQLREEALSAQKQAVEAGEVEIRKTVREEERQIPVNLKHEEVTIERHAVNQPIQGEITDLKDEVIRVPIYEEQAQLTKQGRVAEEVVINKDVVQEQQTLTGTVRREDIDIQQAGDVTRSQGDIRTTRSDMDTDVRNTQTDTNTYDQR